MKTVTDQLKRSVDLPDNPRRIVSLVPSQTELLFDLGLQEQMVGITKFCIHPADKVKDVVKVGGTKKYHMDRIAALQPDLIIGNKEENEEEQIKELMQHYPVWISDIFTLEDALEMISSLGEIMHRNTEATALVQQIKTNFQQLPPIAPPLRVAYFIWKDPIMVAGKNTFINHLLQRCGCENVFSNTQRYPEVTPSQLEAANLDVILLSSEPFPFAEKHIVELQQQFPNTRIELVDGEYFSWYGSRLRDAPKYFASLMQRLTN